MLVDGFNGQQIGDVSNADHDCTIGFEEGELRPLFETYQSSMEYDEDSSNEVQVTTWEVFTACVTPPYCVACVG